MSALAPLAMSQTKEDLLKHLNMGPETYAMMAKETDRVYKWLTSEKRHLKKNCKRKPPYDWSDIAEKSKDEAMEHLAQSGDAVTNYYWSLASSTNGCPNWIARWFLYHKFRYRDGRNKVRGNSGKRTSGSRSYHSSDGGSKHSHARHKSSGTAAVSNAYYGTRASYPNDAMGSGASAQSYGYSVPASSTPTAYSACGTEHAYEESNQMDEQDDGQASKPYYDPVRDV